MGGWILGLESDKPIYATKFKVPLESNYIENVATKQQALMEVQIFFPLLLSYGRKMLLVKHHLHVSVKNKTEHEEEEKNGLGSLSKERHFFQSNYLYQA